MVSESGGSITPPRDSTPTATTITSEKFMSPSSPEAVSQDQGLPEVIKLSRSKGAKGLGEYYAEGADGLYFSNSQNASAAMKDVPWQPPTNDDTIPKNEEEDRLVVRRLVSSFMNLEDALDTPDNAYRKRFTPGTNVFYMPWTVEKCAWVVLDMVKSMHTTGFKSPITDVDILKCIGQTEKWTFDERIGMICRVLKLSKSVAVSLMKQEKIWTVIGAPHKLFNSSIVNTQSNAHRNKWVKAGREADKGHTILPRPRKAEPPAKKRKVSHEHGPQPASPLATDVSTPAFTTATNNISPAIRYATGAADIAAIIAADGDVEMEDAAAHDLTTPDDNNIQINLEAESEEKSKTNAETNAEINAKGLADMKAKAEADKKMKTNIKSNIGRHLKANPKPKLKVTDNASDIFMTDTNDTATSPLATSSTAPAAAPTVTYTSAPTASADLDAAQLLLGLRRA